MPVEPDGIDIEDRRRVGIVPHLRRIAGEAQDVLQPDGRSADQVRLDGEQVAVAAGIVQHRLDADLLLDLDAQALRAHARAGPRRVGDVDGVDSQPVQQRRALDLLVQSMPLGGTISTSVQNSPAAISAPTLERWASGSGSTWLSIGLGR